MGEQGRRRQPDAGVVFKRNVTVALPEAGERGDEGAEVVVGLGVVAALDPELDEGQLRVDELELRRLFPDWIESVLGKRKKREIMGRNRIRRLNHLFASSSNFWLAPGLSI